MQECKFSHIKCSVFKEAADDDRVVVDVEAQGEEEEKLHKNFLDLNGRSSIDKSYYNLRANLEKGIWFKLNLITNLKHINGYFMPTQSPVFQVPQQSRRMVSFMGRRTYKSSRCEDCRLY